MLSPSFRYTSKASRRMARWTRRRAYGRGRRATRRRGRRYGKRRSFGRVRSRRVVTRRVLQRALRPLRPELKVVEFRNSGGSIVVDTSASPADANTFMNQPGSSTARGDWVQLDGSRPVLLSDVDKGVQEYQRVGREIRIRRIDIRARWHTTAAQTITPTTMRVLIMRSGALPQDALGSTGTLGTGRSYPCIAQPTTGTNSPCTWLYQSSKPNALPTLQRTPASKQLARIVKVWKRRFSPNLTTTAVAPSTWPSSEAGRSQYYMRITIKPKGVTVFEDGDTSGLSGYAAQGHYWFQATTDQGTIQCDTDEMNVRMWYTDA